MKDKSGEKKLYIIGASGHGKVATDIDAQIGYTIFPFSDNPDVRNCGRYSVVVKLMKYKGVSSQKVGG